MSDHIKMMLCDMAMFLGAIAIASVPFFSAFKSTADDDDEDDEVFFYFAAF